MGLFENFPYSNFHELNLDWILHKLKELETEITNFVAINSVKYANPIVWDITSQYETNTVVLDSSGNAYLSVQPVPAGVALDREEYWTKIGNFSALWDSVRSAITPYDEQHSTTASIDHKPGDWVWLENDLLLITKNITAGDKYVDGSNCKKTTVHDLFSTLGDTITGEVNALSIELQNEITARTNGDANLEQKINENSAELKNSLFFLNPTSFGAVGDGVTDDSDAINATIAQAIEEGKQVAFEKKTYFCTKTINVPGNTVIDMNGATILSSAENGILIGRSDPVATTTITAAFTGNAFPTFNVADASNFNIGDVVNVEDRQNLYETSRAYFYRGCTAVVVGKSGNTLTLSNAPTTDIAVGSVIYTYGSTCAEIRNGIVRGSNITSCVCAIYFYGCLMSKAVNMEAENFHKCIAFYYCDSCTAEFCKTGHAISENDAWDSYGIVFASCNMCSALHCITASGQHGITHGGWTPTSNSYIANCEIGNENDQKFSLDYHENSVNGIIKNCIIHSGASTYGRVVFENCSFISDPNLKYAQCEIYLSSVQNRNSLDMINCNASTMIVNLRDKSDRKYLDHIKIVNFKSIGAVNTAGLKNTANCKLVEIYNSDNFAVSAKNTDCIRMVNCKVTVDRNVLVADGGGSIEIMDCKFTARYNAVNINNYENVCISNFTHSEALTEASISINANAINLCNSDFSAFTREVNLSGNALDCVNAKLKAPGTITSTYAKFINTVIAGTTIDGRRIDGTIYKETREADGTVKLVAL